MSGNKKILISVISFVLILAVGIGVLSILGGKENKPENSNDVTTPAIIDNAENVSSAAPEADFPEMNFLINATEGEKIQAYISGNYYISAVMHADGVDTEMKFATNGSDFYTTSDIEGMNLGILFKNDKIYMINNTEKKYIDLDSIMAMVGGETGLDMSELSEMTDVLDLSGYNFDNFEESQVDFEGQTANCYKYYADELSIHFYFVENELRQVDYGDAEGVVTTSITVKEFSPTIPSEMLSLSGLRPSTLFDFFGTDFLNQLQ